MRVLGVDPGLAATGYGVVESINGKVSLIEGGVIRSASDDPIDRRVGAMFTGILEVMKEFHPDVLAMEEIYSHYKHPRTAIIMAHARGAILAAAHQVGIPVLPYPSTTIKSSLTGNGRAKKEQVQRMVLDILALPGPIDPLDTSDALAAALCHINQQTGALVL